MVKRRGYTNQETIKREYIMKERSQMMVAGLEQFFENIRIEEQTDDERQPSQVEKSIPEIGKMVCENENERIHGQIEENMPESGKMV